MQNRRVFCGGTFCFDYREDGYEERAAKDYRAKVLGSIEALLKPKGTDGVKISDGVTYVGPFYFETESMKAEDIIRCEKEMIESCTDAVFVLDDADCPGTIAEVCMLIPLERGFICFMYGIGMMRKPRVGCILHVGIRYCFVG